MSYNIVLEAGKENLFIQNLKETYQQQLLSIKQQGKPSGFETCQSITETIDSILSLVYEQITKNISDPDPLCLVAVGGYGRHEMNPYSDVDILFVYEKDDPVISDTISKMLYILWDMKLNISHSSRNLKNIITMSSSDVSFKTSLVHHRLLRGDTELYNTFSSLVEGIFKKNRYTFYKELLEEMKYENQTLGENVLLKEPSVKQSLGGLRGIHLVRWMAYNFYQINSLKELAEQNYIDNPKYISIQGHLDYLLRIRNKLHFLVGRKEDNLFLEYQEKLAHNIQITMDEDNSPQNVERLKIEYFMREFYQRSRHVFQFVQNMMDQFEEESNNYRQIRRFLNRRRSVHNDFVLTNEKLYFNKDIRNIKITPAYFIEIFLLVARYKCTLSQEVEDFIRDNIKKIDITYTQDIEAFSKLKELMNLERNLYHTFSLMNQCGFMSHYFPYFYELECTVQHDYYHAYTVDEHTLQGIKTIEDLYHREDNNFSFFKKVLTSLSADQKCILIFSILYHDIGKGRPGNHVVNGEKMIPVVVDSFPFTDREKDMLSFLVNEHLIMAHTSQRRDIRDLKVLYSFANKMRNETYLNLMTLLTYADMSSVARSVFTIWKGELLRELHNSSLQIMMKSGDEALPVVTPEDLSRIKEKLYEKIPQEDREFAQQFFDNVDAQFIIDQSVEDIIATIKIFKDESSLPHIQYEKKWDAYRLVFYGVDNIGLFSRLTLVLAMNGVTIHHSKLYSKSKGYVIDYFIVGSIFSGDEISETRWDIIKRDMKQYLRGDLSHAERIFEEKKKSFPSVKEKIIIPNTKVHIDNAASEHKTMIEIQTLDCVGLLYKISSVISSHQLNIISAFATTRGNQAIDTFYIETLHGTKLTDEQVIQDLKDQLMSNLNIN